MRKQRRKSKAKHIGMYCAIAAILAGVLGVIILDDVTALVAALIFAPASICSRHIYW